MSIDKSKVNEILKLHSEISKLMAVGLDKALEAGKLLTEIKKSLKHGQWLPWLKENIPISEKSVQRYMLVHKYRERIKNDKMTDLFSALKLIHNLREFDRIADDYKLPSHTKAKICRTITPDMENVELHVNILLPRKTKELRAEIKATQEQGRYVENRIKEIRRELDKVTSKITNLRDYLKSAGLEQIVGLEVRQLLISVYKFNATYELLRPLLGGSLQDEQPKKPVESIERRFPRKELPAAKAG